MWNVIYNICKSRKKFLGEHTSQSLRNKLLIVILKYLACLSSTAFSTLLFIENHHFMLRKKISLAFLYYFIMYIWYILFSFAHIRTLLKWIIVYIFYLFSLYILNHEYNHIGARSCDSFIFTGVQCSFEQITYNWFIRAAVCFHLGLSTHIPLFLPW